MSRVRTVVATEILLLVGLAAFVGICYGIEAFLGVGEATRFSALSALLLGAAPALLWLGYFYLQDRHEPEPKHYVFGIFLLGAFVSGPTAAFLIDQAAPQGLLFRIHFAPFSQARLVLAFTIVGLTQELLKYVVVRYTVYRSPEFDEPMDGIIYMTAAGIGFATYDNIEFLRGMRGEVFLSVGSARVVVTTLAHACFAGVLGYTLGRAKFWTGRPATRTAILSSGLLFATALNGAFSLARDVIVVSGMDVTPWRGVAFAFGFAAVVFFILSILMQRLLDISPYKP